MTTPTALATATEVLEKAMAGTPTRWRPPRCELEQAGSICTHKPGHHGLRSAAVPDTHPYGMRRGKDAAWHFHPYPRVKYTGTLPTRTLENIAACAAAGGLSFWAEHPAPNKLWAIDSERRVHIVEIDRKRRTTSHQCYAHEAGITWSTQEPCPMKTFEIFHWTTAPTMGELALQLDPTMDATETVCGYANPGVRGATQTCDRIPDHGGLHWATDAEGTVVNSWGPRNPGPSTTEENTTMTTTIETVPKDAPSNGLKEAGETLARKAAAKKPSQPRTARKVAPAAKAKAAPKKAVSGSTRASSASKKPPSQAALAKARKEREAADKVGREERAKLTEKTMASAGLSRSAYNKAREPKQTIEQAVIALGRGKVTDITSERLVEILALPGQEMWESTIVAELADRGLQPAKRR